MKNKENAKKKQTIRNNEYYNMQYVFDDLYARSKQKHNFYKLYEEITREENILLAYRNIKSNTGSKTKGTDGKTIKYLSEKTSENLVQDIKELLSDYKPKAVRRVFVPKSNGKLRPLGIPTIEDRIIQQCIKQVLEPICEAQFYKYSFGFRPNRGTKHAISRAYALAQINKLTYVVDIDIKGFFDSVDHGKLLKQMWTMGIRDKRVLSIISKMLKTPIQGEGTPTKGTLQGGILSPLLSNIVLNELDWWVASQWDEIPTKQTFANKGNKHVSLRNKSNLKEIHIVRYADDFKIFCKDRVTAIKTYNAIQKWLKERLNLDISSEKSKVTNLKKEYSEFLGIKFKLKYWDGKWTVKSHLTDKNKERILSDVKHQLKKIRKYNYSKYVYKYNSMIIGYHQYFNMVTKASYDFHKLNYRIYWKTQNKNMNTKEGITSKYYDKMYKQYKYKPIYLRGVRIIPLDAVTFKTPMQMGRGITPYTKEGREKIHKEKGKNKIPYLQYLLENTIISETVEYNDNRISLYVAQQGKCWVTGEQLEPKNMHCHHKIPKQKGGTDDYANLVIVLKGVHELIHSVRKETIEKYKEEMKITKEQITRINKLRKMANLELI